ncbi:MAG: hypothetical protein LBI61_03345 [Puniceicoccales bacterium]|jgi:beta-N-acetylhexosaminidase|nr:hypothetical protein [Puniceicoccales bacterium]
MHTVRRVFFVRVVVCVCAALLVVPRAFGIYSKQDLNEIVGQLIVVSMGDGGLETTKRLLEEGRIGGVIILREDVVSAENLRKITDEIHSVKSKHIPFIAADMEGGLVAALNATNGFAEFPSACEMAKKTPEEAREVYGKMADLLADYHFNVNFAPCVDLASRPDSIIAIKGRSYGSDANDVCKFARSFIDAHSTNGIATCLKHFPGHGSVSGDTHNGFVDATNSWMWAELGPYRNLLSESDQSPAMMVMVSHVFNGNFDDKYPASLSRNSVEVLLRNGIGFGGVIISDSLTMLAIKNNFPLEETVVTSLNAGVDVLLFSNEKPFDSEIVNKIHGIIGRALADGRLDRRKLERSFRRVVSLKKKIGGSRTPAAKAE